MVPGELLKLVTPDNAASFILAAIKVLGQEARTYTGALAYGLNHDDFHALSRVVSALSANRTAFGYRAPTLVSDITKTATKGLKNGDRRTRP
jgi:hypothetical protein